MKNKNDLGKVFRLITMIGEGILAIPVLGGLIVMSLLWLPLAVMLVLHIICLVMLVKDKKRYNGNIVGIVASVLGWIPFLGMMLHITATIILIIELIKGE